MRLLLFSALLLEQYFSLVTCLEGCHTLPAANYMLRKGPLYVEMHGSEKVTKLATILNGNVEMKHNQSVLIGCPRGNGRKENKLRIQAQATTANAKVQPLSVDHVIAKCNNGQMEYSIVGPATAMELKEPDNMACRKSYNATFKYKRTDLMRNIRYTVSFKVPSTDGDYSIQIMDGLLDSENNALFTHMSMQKGVIDDFGSGKLDKQRNDFSVRDNCPNNYRYGDVTQNYSPSYHIKQLLSANPPSGLRQCLQHPQLKKGDNAKIISRGYLAANADFVTAPERAATFCYLNAAPQWQITNGGNFEQVEKYARRTAHRLGRPLEVYTGTHGNAKVVLDGNRVIEARSHTLRIPEVFWKIIYDPIETSALVFIVFNSPCPWNTDLLNALEKPESKCTRKYCKTVGLKLALDKFDVHGLAFCCGIVNAAIEIFNQDVSSHLNELKFLPQVVQDAKTHFLRNNRPPA